MELFPASADVATAILARFPEWQPYLYATVTRCPFCGREERRLRMEIPSEHPTLRQPLVVEAVGCNFEEPPEIRLAWESWHEDVMMLGDDPDEVARETVEILEGWTSDRYAFASVYDTETGRLRRQFARIAPWPQGPRLHPRERMVQWSWRGTHDRTIE